MTTEEPWTLLIESLTVLFLGKAGRLSPLFWISMIAIALFLYFKRGVVGSFWGWLFPKEVYFHPSHITDLKIWLFGRLLSIVSLVSRISFTAIVSASVSGAISGGQVPSGSWHPVLVALLILVVLDFCAYWVHRTHHQWSILWPFHSLHHSAEVLTPFTVYRKHPIYDLISDIVKGIILGTILGIVLGLFVGQAEAADVARINVFYFVFNLVGSNFRHSHVWLSYGRTLEHIFISPAQHQIHHSIEQRHYNKNYGEVLAIWDWMFGTLYVPDREEELTFGLSDGSGTEQARPHPGLWRALWVPIRDSYRAMRSLGKSV